MPKVNRQRFTTGAPDPIAEAHRLADQLDADRKALEIEVRRLAIRLREDLRLAEGDRVKVDGWSYYVVDNGRYGLNVYMKRLGRRLDLEPLANRDPLVIANPHLSLLHQRFLRDYPQIVAGMRDRVLARLDSAGAATDAHAALARSEQLTTAIEASGLVYLPETVPVAEQTRGPWFMRRFGGATTQLFSVPFAGQADLHELLPNLSNGKPQVRALGAVGMGRLEEKARLLVEGKLRAGGPGRERVPELAEAYLEWLHDRLNPPAAVAAGQPAHVAPAAARPRRPFLAIARGALGGAAPSPDTSLCEIPVIGQTFASPAFTLPVAGDQLSYWALGDSDVVRATLIGRATNIGVRFRGNACLPAGVRELAEAFTTYGVEVGRGGTAAVFPGELSEVPPMVLPGRAQRAIAQEKSTPGDQLS